MHARYIKKTLFSIPFLIFIIALAIRLLYLIQSMYTDPMFYNPILDSAIHHNWAISIANGDWIGHESFFRAPFFPYFLGLIYSVFGVNFVIPRVIQIIIGALNCILTLKIGETVFNRKIGIVSGFIAAFYPLFIYFDNELLIPTVLTFFILAGFYMILRQIKRGGSKRGWFVTGIVWGLAAITRPNILLFLVALPFWFRFKLKTKFWPAVVFGTLGVLTMIVPVTIRNYAVSKELVPIAWQGGVNFYVGNNPLSDGKTAIVPGTRKSWMGGFEDARRIAEESAGRELKNSEVDRFWFYKAIEFIRDEPGKAIVLFIKKMYMFWGGYEIPNNRDIYFFTRPTLLKFLLFKTGFLQFPFGILFPLSIVGIYVALKKKRDISLLLLLTITYFVSFILFFVTARYRVPVIPFLIILASFATIDTIACIAKRKSCLYQAVIFAITFILFNANFTKIKDNPALNNLTIGTIEYQKKNYDKAVNYIEKALPHYSNDADVLGILGDCYKFLHKPEKALLYFQKALSVNPLMPGIHDNIGNMYYVMGQFNEAKPYLLRAAEVDPQRVAAYVNLGHIFSMQDSLELALENYTAALDINPDNPTVLYYAGLAEYKLKHLDRAADYWQRVLMIDPNNQDARHGLQTIRAMPNR